MENVNTQMMMEDRVGCAIICEAREIKTTKTNVDLQRRSILEAIKATRLEDGGMPKKLS
jgi:hypothetical protein